MLAITGGLALRHQRRVRTVPALQASRVNLRRDAGRIRQRRRLRAARAAGRGGCWSSAEVALGVVLLVGAGLLIRSFDHLMRLQSPGFDSTHVMTATLSLQDARYQTSDAVARLFDDTLGAHARGRRASRVRRRR